MAELVDAHDSNSCFFGSVGSTPTPGTKKSEACKQASLFLCDQHLLSFEQSVILTFRQAT